MSSVNGFLRTIIDDLVEKRLWPFAAALVIALIAIPVLLTKSADTEPEPLVGSTPAVASGGPLSAFEPVVNTDGKKSSEIRKDLKGFETKDPFKPQNLGGGGGTGGGSVEVQGGDTTVTGSTGGGSTSPSADVSDAPPLGTSGGGSGDGSTPGAGAGTEPQTFYYSYAADVRFGKEGNLDRKTLQQFRSLPSSEDPVVVFMGVKEDGETAVFLLSSAATSTGEGNCEPDDTCTFLHMKAGDEQRIEAVNQNDEVITYELVLLDIEVKRTDGPEKAQTSSRRNRSTRSVEGARGNVLTRGFQRIGF